MFDKKKALRDLPPRPLELLLVLFVGRETLRLTLFFAFSLLFCAPWCKVLSRYKEARKKRTALDDIAILAGVVDALAAIAVFTALELVKSLLSGNELDVDLEDSPEDLRGGDKDPTELVRLRRTRPVQSVAPVRESQYGWHA